MGYTNDKSGIYYPNVSEMKVNLEKSGYKVTVENNSNDNYAGTHLISTKSDEFIELY